MGISVSESQAARYLTPNFPFPTSFPQKNIQTTIKPSTLNRQPSQEKENLKRDSNQEIACAVQNLKERAEASCSGEDGIVQKRASREEGSKPEILGLITNQIEFTPDQREPTKSGSSALRARKVIIGKKK